MTLRIGVLTLAHVAVVDRRARDAGHVRPRRPEVHRDGRGRSRPRRRPTRSCAGSATGSSTAAIASARGSRSASQYTQRPVVMHRRLRARRARACSRRRVVRWRHRLFFVAAARRRRSIIAVGPSPVRRARRRSARSFKAFANSSTRGARAAQHRPGRAVRRARARGAARARARTRCSGGVRAARPGRARRRRVGARARARRRELSRAVRRHLLRQEPPAARGRPGVLDAGDRSTSTRSGDSTRACSRSRAATSRRTVGQHRRPDHAGADGPPVRGAGADSVRHRRAPPICSMRSTAASRSGVADPAGLAALSRRMGVGAVVMRNDIQYERYNLVAPARDQPRDRADARARAADRRSARPRCRTLRDRGRRGRGGRDRPRRARERAAPLPGGRVSRWRTRRRSCAPSRREHSLMIAATAKGSSTWPTSDCSTAPASLQYIGVVPDARRRCAPRSRPTPMLVVTDENRRRARRWSTVRDNVGYTEQAGEKPLVDDPSDAAARRVPRRAGRRAATTTQQRGIKSIQASVVRQHDHLHARGPRRPARSTAMSRPRGARPRSATRSASASASSSTAPITTDHVNLVQPLTSGRNRWITKVELIFDGGRSESRRARRVVACGRRADRSRSAGAGSRRSRSASPA